MKRMDIRKRIFAETEQAEYVSFDIFDTLIIRSVRFPYQIFDKTYEKDPSLFPSYINAGEWREIRIQAEQFARERKRKSEVTLKDIYRELPSIIKYPESIMEREIDAEVENTYLNPQVADILEKIKNGYGKKILLISDMYLPEAVIRRMLETSGLDLSMICQIYISSEYGTKKSNGTLYQTVCDKLRCTPGDILHIGDNWNGDFLEARKKGLRAVYYPIISEGRRRYPYLDYEYGAYGDAGREIYSVRLLAAENDLWGEDREWYELGAMVLGPLLTFAADWVLDTAEENKIHNIYPMMREGRFLGKLLKRAAQERNWEGHIEPMYISRKALYPGVLTVLKKKDIDYILDTRNMLVGTTLELFGLTEELPELKDFHNLTLCDGKKQMVGEKSVYKILEEYLTRQSVMEEIRQKSKDADLAVWNYFKQMKMDCEDFITLDIGWRGNAQNAIERIRRNRGAKSKAIHLLVAGKKGIIKERNLEDQTDIRGFGANFGKNFQTISKLMLQIVEILILCDEGTTTGYEITENGVVPICKTISYSSGQLRMMDMVQAGALNFQNTFYAVIGKKGQKIRQKGEELLKILSRLTVFPTRREAELIGRMQFDQNFGVDTKWQIISPENLNRYKSLGYNRFVHQGYAREDEWYQGMDVCLDSLVYYRQIMFYMRKGFSYQYAMFAERICQMSDFFVLAGAGRGLKELLLYLKLMNMNHRVEFIVDNNIYLCGERIDGHLVCGPETESKSRCYVITLYHKDGIRQLTRQLQELKGQDIKIIEMYS